MNELSIRLNMNMISDRFHPLSLFLCPQASLSNQPAICFKGSQGVRCFAYSLMSQKLNALITSDLLWSTLVTVLHNLFDSYAFNKHMHALRVQANVMRIVMILVSLQLVDSVAFIYLYFECTGLRQNCH